MPQTNPDKQSELLAIGRLGAPFGVQGFLRVHSYSGETSHFAPLREILITREGERRMIRIEEARISGTDVLLRLEGLSSPEEASRWTGWEILVPRSSASPLGPDEYYIADLAGCELIFGGSPVGVVETVLDGGEAPLLEIRRESGRAVLVPFRREFIGEVDMANRSIELLVDWILE